MIRQPPRSTLSPSSAASDVYKRQVVDVKIQDKTLKNIYIWLINEDINSILPPQYWRLIEEPIDLVLGSTTLENFGIRLVKDEKSGSMSVIIP